MHEWKCSAEVRFVCQSRGFLARPIFYSSAVSRLSYPDAVRFASPSVGGCACISASRSVETLVEAPNHSVDEGNWDFANAPSTGSSFTAQQQALYIQLCKVGNELIWPVPRDILGYLCFSEDRLHFRHSAINLTILDKMHTVLERVD